MAAEDGDASMTEEHKHIWAAAGCYCGAQRCEFKIARKVIAEPSRDRYGNPVRMKKVALLTDPCPSAAVDGEIYCDLHVGMKPASPLGGAG
jgi:hypothetical protein